MPKKGKKDPIVEEQLYDAGYCESVDDALKILRTFRSGETKGVEKELIYKKIKELKKEHE